MPVTLILRAITSEFILYLSNMDYEILDPEDMPLTPEWEEEREWRLRTHLQFVESLETDDLDTDIRYCRRASHR